MKAYGDDTLVKAALDDPASASIEPRLRTTLAFLEKLTLQPWQVSAADIAPMRAAGLSDEAIEEAIMVCTTFNIIDRLADAFDFELSTGKQLEAVAQLLTRVGYRIGVVPGGGG